MSKKIKESEVSKTIGYDPGRNIPDVIDPIAHENINEELSTDDTIELSLALAKQHPQHCFRIGSVIVKGYQFEKYSLSKKEFEELLTVGPMFWVKCENLDLVKAKEDYKK